MEKLKKIFAYPPLLINYFLAKIYFNPLWGFINPIRSMGTMPKIKTTDLSQSTDIDKFWSNNTVYAPLFQSASQSQANLQWRFRIHPMFRELTGLYGDHDNEVILDYGCGPGNDIVGFALYSNAQKIIGMDISYKSLALASHRLGLHKVDPQRIELIQVHDAEAVIQLPDNSVDFINCEGVLMHTSYPDKILGEFYRILKPNSKACIMVYSQPSIWFNLYTAYEQMIVKNKFSSLEIDQAFTRNTDGLNCPMSRCYPITEFIQLCKQAGFDCEFAGGYLTESEIATLRVYLKPALNDKRLGDMHKQYLHSLIYDKKSLPKYQGFYAGVSGVYHLQKK